MAYVIKYSTAQGEFTRDAADSRQVERLTNVLSNMMGRGTVWGVAVLRNGADVTFNFPAFN